MGSSAPIVAETRQQVTQRRIDLDAWPPGLAVTFRRLPRQVAPLELVLVAGNWCAGWPVVTVGAVSLADAWEHNSTEWIAWARAPGHDDVFWEGTWPTLAEMLLDSTGPTLD
jgi:hypothetical protein